MNILFINENWYPDGSGGEIYFYNLARKLYNMGHKIFIITSRLTEKIPQYNNEFKFIKLLDGPKNTSDFSILMLLKRVKFFIQLIFSINTIKKYNIQIIHTRTPLCSIIGLFIKKIYKIPVITSVLALGETRWYNIINNKFKSLLFSVIERFSLKLNYDKILIISSNYEKYLNSIGITSDKIEYIPNGIDIEKFNPNCEGTFRKKLNISNDYFIIGYIGTINIVKRVDLIIKFFQQLNEKYFLIIAGTGTLENHLKKEFSHVKNIIFLGKINHSLVPNLIASIDALVLLSSSEGLPGVCLEAISMKKPIIISKEIDIDVFDKYLRYNYKIDTSNPSEFIKVINFLKIIKENNDTSKLFKNEVLKNYSWDVIASKINKLYKIILQNRQRKK
ncbi:MAG: glycosyltransferase family 4 protein [Candidatus Helarchaeota archaeon]